MDLDAEHVGALANATVDGTMPFPAIVEQLATLGVESYHVDFAAGAFRFYNATGRMVGAPLRIDGLPPIATAFDGAMLRDAILESQRHGQPFPAFCRRAVAAGVQGYIVFLRGQRVTYFGRQGDQHTEWFPGAREAVTTPVDP